NGGVSAFTVRNAEAERVFCLQSGHHDDDGMLTLGLSPGVCPSITMVGSENIIPRSFARCASVLLALLLPDPQHDRVTVGSYQFRDIHAQALCSSHSSQST
ncbi:hypothetical protein PQR36_32875, partial [Paraburkholderia nemoris]|uniref:hypothetical protein n=1 Tax=Paraburkholderia nemoris TaxID=2793076 RepID=UPI0038B91F30